MQTILPHRLKGNPLRWLYKGHAVLLILVFWIPIVRAQTHLVKDMNLAPSWGFSNLNGTEMADVNGVIFFIAQTETTGGELWTSNGTLEGTYLVKDIYPGVQASWPSDLTNVNGVLYFTASDNAHGRELWKSDGTEAGTVMVKDIYPGSWDGSIANLTEINNSLFFSAGDPINGIQLWKSDGEEATTQMVKVIHSGGNSNIQDITNVNGTAYFSASDNTHGVELWKSNGTEAGTVIVKDIRTGINGSGVDKLFAIGSTLYFRADDGVNGLELFKSDGTDAGTVMVKDIVSGSGSSYPQDFTNLNGNLFFYATTSFESTELWTSDGSSANTFLVKDIRPGQTTSYTGVSMVTINNEMFFTANNGTDGTELWKTTGTEAGTVMVKDIAPGALHAYPQNLTEINGELFFSTLVGGQYELWKSDGADAGTILFKDINPTGSSNPGFFINASGRLYFWADNGINGKELWKSDGTPASTVMVKDINSSTAGSGVGRFMNHNGTLYFSPTEYYTPTTSSYYSTLWKTTGVDTETEPVEDEYSSGWQISSRISFKGSIIFAAYDFTLSNKVRLWKTDGSLRSAVAVSPAFAQYGNIENLTVVGDLLYFTTDDGVAGVELWKTDGTPEGTVLVKDINNGISGSYPGSLINVNGILFFTANNGINGDQLWKCDDGTAAGTVMVKNIKPSGWANPGNFTNVNGTLYFSVSDDGVYGREFWKSDGSAAGTMIVKDINPGSQSSNPSSFTEFNGTTYFTANDGVHGYELWKYDGTTGDPVLLKDINPGAGDGNPYNLIAVNGFLYFVANDGLHGYELWKSDGTPEGTMLVSDLTPGVTGSDLTSFISYNNKLFFYSDERLWKSEGDACNTVPLTNASDVVVTDWEEFLVINDKLYFVGISNEVGDELFYYDFSNVSTPGCTQTIAFDAVPSKTFGEPAFDLTASASSGLSLTFTSSDPSIATVNGKTITIVGTGTATITATQAGDINYASAETSQTITVNKADQTITFGTQSPKVFGNSPFDLTGSASSGLELSYKSSNTDIATVNGKTVTILKAGTITITASQAGNNNYVAAADVQQSLVINKASQTLTFGSLPSKAATDPAFNLSATTTSGLAVTFTSSNPDVATINGERVTILGVGTTTITASQPGNENYLAAADEKQSLVINKTTQTLIFASLPVQIVGSAPFDLNSVATSGLTVTFTSSDPAVATINGKTVTIAGAGEAKITASQVGNNNYEAAISVEQLLTVNKKSQTITFEAISEKILQDDPFTLVATSSSGLPVTFTSSNTQVATVNGHTVTITGHGETVIRASNGGNAEYNEAVSIMQLFTVKLITGNAEYDLAEETKIYPNPTSDYIVIEGKYLDANISMNVVDTKGVPVTGKLDITPFSDRSYKVDVSNLSAGIYVLKISTGKDIIVKRIVKR